MIRRWRTVLVDFTWPTPMGRHYHCTTILHPLARAVCICPMFSLSLPHYSRSWFSPVLALCSISRVWGSIHFLSLLHAWLSEVYGSFVSSSFLVLCFMWPWTVVVISGILKRTLIAEEEVSSVLVCFPTWRLLDWFLRFFKFSS